MSAPEDFVEWVAGSRSRLLRSAYLLTGDLGLAEDLVQEAVIKVAQRWSRLRHQQPTAYARTIIVRDNATWWRRRREIPVEHPEPDEPAQGDDPDTRRALVEALALLPPRQRAVVVLRYLDDLSERETAEVLHVSVGTVKSQAHHALERLRQHDGLRHLTEEEPTR